MNVLIQPLPSKNPRVIRVRFNGIVYRRYPESKRMPERNYYRCGHGDVLRGYSFLHRDIWRHIHGPIPAGCEIHHRDENPLNNEPGNLECLTSVEHRRKHEPTARQRGVIAWKKRLGKVALQSAAAWHRSPEGRAWHSVHGRMAFLDREPTNHVCEECNESFQSLARRGSTRFCSPKCKAAFRRKSGVDDVKRMCANCDKEFLVNRFADAVLFSKLRCQIACRSNIEAVFRQTPIAGADTKTTIGVSQNYRPPSRRSRRHAVGAGIMTCLFGTMMIRTTPPSFSG